MGFALVSILAWQDASGFLSSGDEKLGKGDLDGALADFTKAIELDPKSAPAHAKRGEAKRRKDDFDGAILDLTKAIDLDPNYGWAYAERGEARRQRVDLDGAIADLTRAIELDPNDGWALSRRGDAKRQKGDGKGAVEDLTRAVAIDPQDAWAYLMRGYAEYDQQLWKNALADVRKACELDPEAHDYPRLYLWLIRARLGERDAATQELKDYLPKRKWDNPWGEALIECFLGRRSEESVFESAESKEWRCEAYFYAGARRIVDGDKAKAREYFQKCLDTGVRGFVEYTSAAAELAALRKE